MSWPRPTGFGKEVITQLSPHEHPCEAQGEEETQAPKGFLGGLSNTFRDGGVVSGGRGRLGKDLAPRLSPRARTSLYFFLLHLYPPLDTLHETFLGDWKKSQVRSLHKNSLMENFRGNRRWKNHKTMQAPNQSILVAQEIFTSWVPLCQRFIKKQSPPRAPGPRH